jgi:ABC-type glycerol-3-phosphate transport system substrate-binding protein
MGEPGPMRTNHTSPLVPRRTFLKGTAATAGAAALSGISGILAAQQAPAAGQRSVELRFYDWKLTDKPPRKALEAIAAEFQKKYPNIKVKLEEVSWPDHQKKLVVLAQGGSPPDVARITDAGVLPLADIGAIVPLTEWALRNKADDFLTKIPQSVRKGLQYKGADYIACATASMDILTWNKALFKEAGLNPEKPPITWDELAEVARKLTDPKKDQYGWGIMSERSNSASRRVIAWILSGGGELFNEKGSELIANSEGGLRGFQFWADLALKYKATPPGSANAAFRDVMRGYGQGKIAMFDGGPNNPKMAEVDYPGILERTDMGPMPDPWRCPLRSTGFVVMNGSKYKEEAMLLVSWMTSVYGQVEYGLESYEVPIRSDAAGDPKLKRERLLMQSAAQAKRGVANPALHIKFAEIEQKLFDAMQATLAGSKSAKQALDDFIAEGNKILRRG